MAVRVPTELDLGTRVIPEGRRAIVPDQTGAIRTQAIGELVDIAQIADQKNDRFHYAQARSSLLQADIKARQDLESDPDFDKHEERYRAAMEKAQDDSSQMIRDSRDRALFGEATRADIARGAFEVNQNSQRLIADKGRADLDTNLEANRTGALTAKDPGTRAAFIQSTQDLIKGAVAKRWIDQDVGVATWQKWQASYAEGYAAMLDPAEREKVLKAPKGTPAEFLRPDDRAKLIEVAQNANKETRVRGASQQQSDSIFAAGGSLESMRGKARKIEDPDVRDATIMQLESRFADRENDRNRYDEQNRRAAWDIVDRTHDWNAVPEDLAARMDPRDKVAIKDWLAGGGQAKTDKEVWYRLEQLAGDDPAAFAKLDLLQYKHQLGTEDFEQFGALQGKIKENVRNGDPIQTDNQLVAGALRELRIKTTGKIPEADAARAQEFRYAFQQQVTALYRATGKPPSIEDKQKIRDRLMIEVVTGDNLIFPDPTARLFEAPNVVGIVVPKGERKAIVEALQRANKDVTEERIQEMYLRGRGLIEDQPAGQ